MTAAIAAAQTTLTTAIGAVSTTLATNHYTKSEVDGGISSAVGVASTTLGGQIDDVAADLVDEAGFRVAGDEALAGRVSTIEARSDPGSIVSNGSFATGSFAGWSCRAASTAAFSVGGARRHRLGAADLPVALHAQDRGRRRARPATICNETCEAKQGDVSRPRRSTPPAATTRDVTLRFIVRFLDVAGPPSRSPFTEVLNYTGTAWARLQTPGCHRAGEHRLRALRAAALAGRLRRRLRHRHRGPQGRRRSARAHLGRRVRRRRRLRRDHLAADQHQRQLRLAERLPLADLGRGRHASTR